jgi:hypothetical protein
MPVMLAVQFATAWSSTIVGVGVIAGGPFYCAQGSPYDFPLGGVLRATGPCMTNDQCYHRGRISQLSNERLQLQRRPVRLGT